MAPRQSSEEIKNRLHESVTSTDVARQCGLDDDEVSFMIVKLLQLLHTAGVNVDPINAREMPLVCGINK